MMKEFTVTCLLCSGFAVNSESATGDVEEPAREVFEHQLRRHDGSGIQKLEFEDLVRSYHGSTKQQVYSTPVSNIDVIGVVEIEHD